MRLGIYLLIFRRQRIVVFGTMFRGFGSSSWRFGKGVWGGGGMRGKKQVSLRFVALLAEPIPDQRPPRDSRCIGEKSSYRRGACARARVVCVCSAGGKGGRDRNGAPSRQRAAARARERARLHLSVLSPFSMPTKEGPAHQTSIHSPHSPLLPRRSNRTWPAGRAWKTEPAR